MTTALQKPTQTASLTLAILPTIVDKLAAAVLRMRWTPAEAERATLARVQTHVIEDATSYEDMGRDVVQIKRVRRDGEQYYDALKRPFNALLASIRGLEAQDVSPWRHAEARGSNAILAWKRDQDRQAELARLREQARRDDESRAQRQREVDALAAVAASELDTVVAAALHEEAQALAVAPIPMSFVPVEPATPLVPGLSFAKSKRAEIAGDDQLLIFVKAIGRKPQTGFRDVPLRAVLGLAAVKDRPSFYGSPFLNDQAKALGADLRYPGVIVVDDEGTRGR